MKIEQIYTGCLAQGAYYIESNGEIAIIDPLREVQPYIDKAELVAGKIKYIFETHFHADFVSGHVDLAKQTGATIVYGPTTVKTGFEALIARDGQMFDLGEIQIKLIHTPGHTMESSCYLLIDQCGNEKALFTGDTLFIGDVGRPDLAQHIVSDLTEEKLASHLYDSLRNKLMVLNDDIIVYPAHGAGSACGKKMSKETYDTLGNQKIHNYALNPSMSKTEFVKQVLTGLTPPPAYFPKNVLMNINGYEDFDNVMERGKKALDVVEFENIANQFQALILDTRNEKIFSKGFIPGSINIGIDGSFAVWVGTLIVDIQQPILIVSENGREEEIITRLARVGYDNTLGFLKGGFDAWKSAQKYIDTVSSINAKELSIKLETEPNLQVLDVRKKSEYDSEHLVGSQNIPLDYINENMDKINNNQLYYLHCAAGYRSMIFASILKSRGYEKIVNVEGGFASIKQEPSLKITEYVCPSTLL